MKRKVIYLCCITAFTLFVALPPEKVTAQNKLPYEPLVVENAHWEVGFYSTENPPWAPFQMYQYLISGDSVLNGKHYKKLYYRDLDDVDPEFILSEGLYGLMREDTLNRKVYAITYYNAGWCPVNEEFQLYDFDIEVGDTTIFLCLVGDQLLINQIDYEYIFNKERKLFRLNDPEEYLIEGVGTNYGLLEWGYFVKRNEPESKGSYYELANFCIGTDEECGYFWVGIKDEIKFSNFKVYPNPFHDNIIHISLAIPYFQTVEISFYNLMGSEVYQTSLSNIITEQDIILPASLSGNSSPLLLIIRNRQQIIFKQLIFKQ